MPKDSLGNRQGINRMLTYDIETFLCIYRNHFGQTGQNAFCSSCHLNRSETRPSIVLITCTNELWVKSGIPLSLVIQILLPLSLEIQIAAIPYISSICIGPTGNPQVFGNKRERSGAEYRANPMHSFAT